MPLVQMTYPQHKLPQQQIQVQEGIFLFFLHFFFLFSFFFPQRFLPRLPNNEDEIIETSPAMTRRGAMSPSVASGIFSLFSFFFHFSNFFSFLVTSGSTNASGVDGNQRRLDWDPLADFGYEAHISRVCHSDFT